MAWIFYAIARCCLKLAAAKDILDRAGFKPKDEQDISLRQIDISIDYGDGEKE